MTSILQSLITVWLCLVNGPLSTDGNYTGIIYVTTPVRCFLKVMSLSDPVQRTGSWLVSRDCIKHCLRGPGGSKSVGSWKLVIGVFWKRTARFISWFLPHQKILILAKVIAGRSLALMCNSITCANFNRNFPKMAIFQTSIPYWAYSFHGIILKLGRH